jgi:Tol biopolymer transport system component
LLTLNIDGSDLRCLADDDLVSHYDWRDEHQLLAWARQRGRGDGYFLFDDANGAAQLIGQGVLTSDGHCSFSPDRRWILTDTYPDGTQHRTLLLYEWETGERIDIGRYFAPPVNWEIRCDLHPRWSPDGRQICLDSVHEGSRQMYVLDVAAIVAASRE